ncbi:MAG: PEP-CTERM sorting domain-containing protein [Candidatus Spyradenecus sp.]
MKKLLLLTCMALASLAQAVTYTWSNHEGTASSWGGNFSFTTSISLSFAADATVASTFPTSGSVALTQILIAKRNDTYTLPTSVTLSDQNGTVIATTTSVTSPGNIVTTMSNGSYYTRGALALIFDNAVVNVNSTYLLKAYDADNNAISFGTSVVRNEANTAWIPSMEITATSIDIPEPTVLALIALGIGGALLRRKHL